MKPLHYRILKLGKLSRFRVQRKRWWGWTYLREPYVDVEYDIHYETRTFDSYIEAKKAMLMDAADQHAQHDEWKVIEEHEL